MKFTCTAILPYYKEGPIAIEVVKGTLAIPLVDEVIFVDDGSNDGIADEIKKDFPRVTVIQYSKNKGKSAAVEEGLKLARGEYILLIDTDLRNFDSMAYKQGLEKAKEDPTIDLIVFLLMGDAEIWKMMRLHYVLTGQRLLKRADLLNIFKSRPYRFQLEVSINRYMMQNHKNVYWMQTKTRLVTKNQKVGFLKGEWQEIKAGLQIYSFAGPLEYWKQLLLFCRKQLP